AILERASASKGAFFHHFPSKAQLGRALVERYRARDSAILDEAMQAAETASNDPAEQLVAFTMHFEALADGVVATQPSCLFVSFIYERDLAEPETAEAIRVSILHWRRRIRAKLEQATASRPHL